MVLMSVISFVLCDDPDPNLIVIVNHLCWRRMFVGALTSCILNGFPRSIFIEELASLNTNLKEGIPHGENLESRNPPEYCWPQV